MASKFLKNFESLPDKVKGKYNAMAIRALGVKRTAHGYFAFGDATLIAGASVGIAYMEAQMKKKKKARKK
jgi:hypothetical protein